MNISSKTREKLALQGNILRFFSPRYSQNYILNEKFNPKIESWPFLLKSGHFFRFPKKVRGGGATSPLVAGLLCLNIHQFS